MNTDAISRKMIRSTIQDLQRRREEILNEAASLSGRKGELLEQVNQIGAKIEWLTDHVAELESYASSPSIIQFLEGLKSTTQRQTEYRYGVGLKNSPS